MLFVLILFFFLYRLLYVLRKLNENFSFFSCSLFRSYLLEQKKIEWKILIKISLEVFPPLMLAFFPSGCFSVYVVCVCIFYSIIGTLVLQYRKYVISERKIKIFLFFSIFQSHFYPCIGDINVHVCVCVCTTISPIYDFDEKQ